MIGGGKWNVQNKKLNGTYINFVSKKSSTARKSTNNSGGGSSDNPSDNSSITTSVLGIAKLGQMILV